MLPGEEGCGGSEGSGDSCMAYMGCMGRMVGTECHGEAGVRGGGVGVAAEVREGACSCLTTLSGCKVWRGSCENGVEAVGELGGEVEGRCSTTRGCLIRLSPLDTGRPYKQSTYEMLDASAAAKLWPYRVLLETNTERSPRR